MRLVRRRMDQQYKAGNGAGTFREYYEVDKYFRAVHVRGGCHGR